MPLKSGRKPRGLVSTVPPLDQIDFDLAAEQERQGRAWRRQIVRELEEDLSLLDDEAQWRNVHYLSRSDLFMRGGTIKDLKRVMNNADVAAIPYEFLWYFINESGHEQAMLSAEQVRSFLQVAPLPTSADASPCEEAEASICSPFVATPERELPKAEKKPRLSNREIRAAVEAYVDDPKNAGFRDKDILEDLRAQFPDHRIPRDPVLDTVRAILPGRKPGPRPIREKNSA